jgi:ubiquitin-protein ligase
MSGSASSNFRIQKDLKEVLLSDWSDLPPIMAEPVNDRLHQVTALVVGPPETCYHGAFFTFEMKFTSEYPNEPPQVRSLSTSDGRVRLNPNLYADGKVCLSVLGTFRGESTEVWRSSYSIRYVLQAIQTMVLNAEPYHNEPGFEKDRLEVGLTLIVPPNHPSYNDPSAVEVPNPPPKAVAPPPAQTAQPPPQASTDPPLLATSTTEGDTAPAAPEEPAKPVRKRVIIKSEALKREAQGYHEKISHESMRICVCDVLECLLGIPPAPLPRPENRSVSPEQSSPVGVTDNEDDEYADGEAKEPVPLENLVSNSTTPITELGGSTGANVTGEFPSVPPTMAPSVLPATRNQFLIGTRVNTFAAEIKRQFIARYHSYVETASKPEFLQLDGTPFLKATFEVGANGCEGVFRWRWLLARLDNIFEALKKETESWILKGKELTERKSYVAADLFDEAARIGAQVPGISGGPIAPDNAFHWKLSVMSGEGLYEEGFYSVEVVFCPEQDQPPRCRFTQPIWHPNISPDGHFLSCMWEERTLPIERRFSPISVGEAIRKLVTMKPIPHPTSVLNSEAANDCFSRDEAKVKQFRSKARKLARQTVD